MKQRKGWALIDVLDDRDPRNGQFREFEIFQSRHVARYYRMPGQHVIAVEYRFPAKRRKP